MQSETTRRLVCGRDGHCGECEMLRQEMDAEKQTTPWFLTRQQMDEVRRVLADPPPPTPALVALMRDYMERVADGRVITDTTSPDDALRWLEARRGH